MKLLLASLVGLLFIGTQAICADKWYVGDERCPPPKDDGTYSAPYNALEHPHEYPTFAGADKRGWSCSYQNDQGITIQYGDSRTPQEQWRAIWGETLVRNQR